MNRIHGVQNVPGLAGEAPAAGRSPDRTDEFRQLLADLGKTSGIKFSKHALERISSRDLPLDKAQMDKLDAAVASARDKGAKESLVLMDELALIVSVKNKTVITAMSSVETKGSVFTSIDSTVIA